MCIVHGKRMEIFDRTLKYDFLLFDNYAKIFHLILHAYIIKTPVHVVARHSGF